MKSILKTSHTQKYSSAIFGGAFYVLSYSPCLSIDAAPPLASEQLGAPYAQSYSYPLSKQEIESANDKFSGISSGSAGSTKKNDPSLWNFSDGLSQPEHYEKEYSPPSSTLTANSQFETAPDFQNSNSFEQNEIVAAGHSFFGTVTSGLANGIEYLFQSQGKPNAYILGEDAGGAFLLGLRYGEGNMHLKNSPSEKVYWQGPSIGYDAGAEGSKTMILVYNLEDPSQIYDRYAGVQGAVYFIGGVSIQLQKHGNVTLALIRSGVGLRLGANVGYLNYTRTATWNPL